MPVIHRRLGDLFTQSEWVTAGELTPEPTRLTPFLCLAKQSMENMWTKQYRIVILITGRRNDATPCRLRPTLSRTLECWPGRCGVTPGRRRPQCRRTSTTCWHNTARHLELRPSLSVQRHQFDRKFCVSRTEAEWAVRPDLAHTLQRLLAGEVGTVLHTTDLQEGGLLVRTFHEFGVTQLRITRRFPTAACMVSAECRFELSEDLLRQGSTRYHFGFGFPHEEFSEDLAPSVISRTVVCLAHESVSPVARKLHRISGITGSPSTCKTRGGNRYSRHTLCCLLYLLR